MPPILHIPLLQAKPQEVTHPWMWVRAPITALPSLKTLLAFGGQVGMTPLNSTAHITQPWDSEGAQGTHG